MASKQCSSHWTVSRFLWADILGLFNDVRWPEKSGEVRQEPHGPQEGFDLRDQRKTPKQESRRVSKQENKQRKAPGSSARCLQGHAPAHDALFPIDTQCFLAVGCPVCKPLYLSLYQVVCLKKKIYIWFHYLHLGIFSILIAASRMFLYAEECIVFANLCGWAVDRRLQKHGLIMDITWLNSCSLIRIGYGSFPLIPNHV